MAINNNTYAKNTKTGMFWLMLVVQVSGPFLPFLSIFSKSKTTISHNEDQWVWNQSQKVSEANVIKCTDKGKGSWNKVNNHDT